MTMHRFAFFAALLIVEHASAAAIAPRRLSGDDHDDHDDHDHDDHGSGESSAAFEWAGIFEVSGATHTFTLQQVGGSYAEDHMKVVMLPTSSPTESTLHTLESEAEHSFEETCTEVEPGETITPAEDACFELHLEGTDSAFTIDTSGLSGLAIFTEHNPSEFERDTHYLTDSSGADVEAVAIIDEDTDHSGHDHGGGSSDGLPTGALIGIIAGVVVVIGALVGAAVCVMNKKPSASA